MIGLVGAVAVTHFETRLLRVKIGFLWLLAEKRAYTASRLMFSALIVWLTAAVFVLLYDENRFWKKYRLYQLHILLINTLIMFEYLLLKPKLSTYK